MIVVGGELAAGTDDTDQAKNEGEDPAGGAIKAMAFADNERDDERRKIDSEFGDRDAASSIQLHDRRVVEVVKIVWLILLVWCWGGGSRGSDCCKLRGNWMERQRQKMESSLYPLP